MATVKNKTFGPTSLKGLLPNLKDEEELAKTPDVAPLDWQAVGEKIDEIMDARGGFKPQDLLNAAHIDGETDEIPAGIRLPRWNPKSPLFHAFTKDVEKAVNALGKQEASILKSAVTLVQQDGIRLDVPAFVRVHSPEDGDERSFDVVTVLTNKRLYIRLIKQLKGELVVMAERIARYEALEPAFGGVSEGIHTTIEATDSALQIVESDNRASSNL